MVINFFKNYEGGNRFSKIINGCYKNKRLGNVAVNRHSFQ